MNQNAVIELMNTGMQYVPKWENSVELGIISCI